MSRNMHVMQKCIQNWMAEAKVGGLGVYTTPSIFIRKSLQNLRGWGGAFGGFDDGGCAGSAAYGTLGGRVDGTAEGRWERRRWGGTTGMVGRLCGEKVGGRWIRGGCLAGSGGESGGFWKRRHWNC